MGLDQSLRRERPWTEDEPEEVAYFRKVNFLHGWVQTNLNEGKEHNCESIPMNLEQIAGLAASCSRVLDNPALADELLPVQQGFFFGGYDYDEYYLGDVKEVREALRAILADEAERHSEGLPPCRYSYWSWW